MFVCIYSVFVLSCVRVMAFRRADPPSKESYWLFTRSRNWMKAKRFTHALCSRGRKKKYQWMNHHHHHRHH
jgi:hypothetical protein